MKTADPYDDTGWVSFDYFGSDGRWHYTDEETNEDR